MREIKLRGKLMEGADMWVYGSLIDNAFQMIDKTPCCYIFDHNSIGYYDCWEDIADRIDEFKVFPESVGQYSGRKDKNGKEIYEGDICEQITPNHTKIKMVCRWGTFQRTMDTGCTVDISGFCFERSDGLLALPIVENWMGKHDLETLEVIGNIYENPELLSSNHK